MGSIGDGFRPRPGYRRPRDGDDRRRLDPTCGMFARVSTQQCKSGNERHRAHAKADDTVGKVGGKVVSSPAFFRRRADRQCNQFARRRRCAATTDSVFFRTLAPSSPLLSFDAIRSFALEAMTSSVYEPRLRRETERYLEGPVPFRLTLCDTMTGPSTERVAVLELTLLICVPGSIVAASRRQKIG